MSAEPSQNSASLCFIEALRSITARLPDSPAILAPNRPDLSFAALLKQTERTAGVLAGFGLQRGDFVALVMPNGPEMISAIIALITTCTLIVLNPASTEAEAQVLLQRSHAKALIAARDLVSPVRAAAELSGLPVITLDTSSDQPAGWFELEGGHFVTPTFAEADDIAIVIPTSGTTGIPKLVPYTHRDLLEESRKSVWREVILAPTENRLLINVLPLFHLFGFINILTCLGLGYGIIAASGFNADQFYSLLDSYRPVGCRMLPVMFKLVIEAAPRYPDVIARSSLRLFASSSSILTSEVAAEIDRIFHIGISSTYGMTEITTISRMLTSDPTTYKRGSVGKPLREVSILDEDGQPLPAGMSGEVAVHGSKFLGYLDDPESQAELTKTGWFHTGDIGYFDDEHFLFITGRLKEIINRGGEKISPYEVEEILLRHPAVREAAVFGIPHPLLGEDLAAAVVLRDAAVTEKDMRLFAARNLASQKVPGSIRIVDQLPKTPTNKVQRLALAKLLGMGVGATLRQGAAPNGVLARTAIEHQLQQLWIDSFKSSDIGIHDDFFALGGTSLQAAQLILQINQQFQIVLPVSSFLEAPTIAEMADLLTHLGQSISFSSLIPIQPHGQQPPLFGVPGIAGQVLIYRDLSLRLGADQPLYALQTPGSDGKTPPFTRMADLAAHYVSLIRSVQPHGPYRLVGQSYGGIVAFEIAQRLDQQGEQVEMLAILDTTLEETIFEEGWAKRIGRIGYVWEVHRFRLARLDPQAQLQYIRDNVRRKLDLPSEEQVLPGIQAIQQANIEIMQTYRPAPYRQPIIYFRATAPVLPVRRRFYVSAWRKLARGTFEVVDIPCEHQLMLKEPHVVLIAERIKPLLERRATSQSVSR